MGDIKNREQRRSGALGKRLSLLLHFAMMLFMCFSDLTGGNHQIIPIGANAQRLTED